jgi:hypothetical protein
MVGSSIAGRGVALWICALLLMGFSAMAWLAIQTKSPAYDEPYHAVSAWVQLHQHDYRLDNEDPPLWQYWAALPNGPHALAVDFDGPMWRSLPASVVRQWYWVMHTLYRTPGNDPVVFINRSRVMMLLLAIVLGAMIGYWSWKIGGPVAAIVSIALFSLDPNFLADSALMKNDVVFALSLLLLAWALWKAGQKLTIRIGLLIAGLCIFTLTVKFSGLVAVLLVPVMLALRALLPQPWMVMGRSVASRWRRLGVAMIVFFGSAIISYAGIWAVYGFRFRPTPQPGVYLNMDQLSDQANKSRVAAEYGGYPPPGAFDHLQPVMMVRLVDFANTHGLFPQAYLAGFLFTYDNALIRPAYLCGELSRVGWWWYFPLAILVKTPIATLIAGAITGVIILRSVRRGKLADANLQWTALCLAVPFAIFLASAMLSHLNIGIRHVLGLYPFAFIAIGCVAGTLWKRRNPRLGIMGIIVLLAIESVSVFPNFIPYFNFVAEHMVGGINLLGDSNLDWGQDLPLLAQWQREHPNDKLYLCYFGYADPAFYGIRYIPLPGGYHYDPPPQFPDPFSPCVLAISATNLQGIMLDTQLRKFYAQWRKRKPMAVLGGSIYLYRYDPTEMVNRG